MENSPLQNENLDLDDIDIRKIQLYSVRKTLIFIALIDFLFSFFSILSSTTIEDETQRNVSTYTYLGITLMIALGIVGINRYNKSLVYFYAIYLALQLGLKIFLLFYFRWTMGTYIFYFFILLLNSWILKLICKYISNLKNISNEDLISLKSGWIPVTYTVIYY